MGAKPLLTFLFIYLKKDPNGSHLNIKIKNKK